MSEQSPEQKDGENPDEYRLTLLGFVVSREHDTTCTIYPPGVVVPERGSRWIKAVDDGFEDLSNCR
ncbi:DUF7511 domain-containing protein [Halovenus salina]|uniref:DUF7511 domain-containing protein n=1 Tax=Halovenus salina TaxID=1510225 RepID=A0ABD5W7K7_9EURY|nr:hypothetical protein [Halovenus salina]